MRIAAVRAGETCNLLSGYFFVVSYVERFANIFNLVRVVVATLSKTGDDHPLFVQEHDVARLFFNPSLRKETS
jgi:hypothetical protein